MPVMTPTSIQSVSQTQRYNITFQGDFPQLTPVAGQIYKFLVLLQELPVSSATPIPPVPPVPPVPLSEINYWGENLDSNNYYSPMRYFTNAALQSNHFELPDFSGINEDGSLKVRVDQNGYPTEAFGWLVTLGDYTQGGTYLFEAEGNAEISDRFEQSNPFNVNYNPNTNKLTASFRVNPGGQLWIESSAGLKNIKVMRPGYPVNTPKVFTDEFINLMSPVNGIRKTIRFMDLLETNWNTSSTWEERTKPTHVWQTRKNRGIALEYAFMMAKEAQAIPYINLPALCDANYMRQAVRVANTILGEEEEKQWSIGNELWNGMFDASQAFGDFYPGDYGNRLKGLGDRLYLLSTIIAEEGDPTFEYNHIHLEGQGANPDVAGQVLRHLMVTYGRVDFLYSISLAPYFNLLDYDVSEGLSKDILFSYFQRSVNEIPEFFHYQEYAQMAEQYNLKITAYEGGCDTAGDHGINTTISPDATSEERQQRQEEINREFDQFVEVARQANNDPRMATIYTQYLSDWYSASSRFEQFNHFQGAATGWNKFGTWGFAETMPEVETSQKYKGFKQAIVNKFQALST
jgi:hypothetical protein